MHEFRIDIKKNRLYVTFGRVESGEAHNIYDEVKELISNLTPGFTMISDISQFSPEDLSEGPYADKILRFLAGAGLKKVVRVTGRPVTRRVEMTSEYGYLVELAESVEMAEKYLEQEKP